jgi:hypothetical protein
MTFIAREFFAHQSGKIRCAGEIFSEGKITEYQVNLPWINPRQHLNLRQTTDTH